MYLDLIYFFFQSFQTIQHCISNRIMITNSAGSMHSFFFFFGFTLIDLCLFNIFCCNFFIILFLCGPTSSCSVYYNVKFARFACPLHKQNLFFPPESSKCWSSNAICRIVHFKIPNPLYRMMWHDIINLFLVLLIWILKSESALIQCGRSVAIPVYIKLDSTSLQL